MMFGEEMKPRLLNRILAHTSGISALLGVFIALTSYLWLLFEEGGITSDPWTIFWVTIGAIPIGAVGWIVGIILLWWNILGPIALRLQGWPFRAGEEVFILTGNRKGTVARVHEIWMERGQVILDHGEHTKNVYCGVRICSTNKTTEQVEDANAGHAPG